MINNQRVVAVIPARGGSKSVPRKNLRPLGGMPLIKWSIEVARRVPEVDRILVSTDDPEIAAVSRQAGAEVYDRAAALATDQALVIDVLKDLIARLRAERESVDILVLLEPTCPFRQAQDVQGCLRLVAEEGCDSAATFVEAELNPHRAWKITDQTPEPFIEGAIPWLPRQQLPTAYQLNGAVYAMRAGGVCNSPLSLLFGRTGALKMPRERSVDINYPVDFLVAETLIGAELSCAKLS